MKPRAWAASVAVAASMAAALSLVIVRVAQRRYERAFAFRIAGTTASYIAAVTPPPPPPPPPPQPTRVRRRAVSPQPPPPPPATTAASRSYDLPSLLTQARALRTLPGWTSDVEIYFGTAPLVEATAPPLSPEDLQRLTAGGRWRDGAALIPLRDRDGQEIVGAVAAHPRPMPHGPLPGGIGFAFPAAVLAVAGAAAIAFRRLPLRRGGYVGAALLLALATYLDVRNAARQSTDRWLLDTRRLLQEAATRIPAPRSRVSVSDLAAIVHDGEVVTGEPGESAPQRVRIDGERRAVAAVLIGPGRWVELRTTPAEADAPRWLLLLVPCALLGPFGVWLLRWAERTSVPSRRQTAIAWAFLGPAMLHVLIFTVGPALYALYFASRADFKSLFADRLTWIALRNSALYALYVPISVGIALLAALSVHRARRHWTGRLLSSAFLVPYAMSTVAIALLWQVIYQSGSLGLGRPDWLRNSATALPALMLISIWIHTGGQMLVLLAGLRRIPREYLDAAQVDGAGAWRGFWRVTLPLLRPVMSFVLLTGVLGALQMFTLVYVLTQGGPGGSHATDVMTYRMYQTAFVSRAFALASGFGLLIAFVLLVFRWPQLRLMRRAMRADHA